MPSSRSRKLFLSGVLPGLLMAAGMAVIVIGKGLRSNIPREKRATWPEVKAALREGIWALLAPVVVLGGIYAGAFTPTEAAVVSCLYALFVGVVIERRLTLASLPKVISSAMTISAIVMAIIAVSNGFSFLVAQEQLATKLASWLATHFQEKWTMLLALNIAFFLLAAVMDEIAIMVILGPMLISIANQFQVDPIHFGAMIVTNVAIGMAAPPDRLLPVRRHGHRRGEALAGGPRHRPLRADDARCADAGHLRAGLRVGAGALSREGAG